MNSFEMNKLIGAFLATIFVMFSVILASDALFATHAPETPGFAIEVAEAPAGGGAAAEDKPSALSLLASADPAAGEAVFRKCAACHTADKGGANKIGPNLWDVVNRPIASHEGFSYSSAMREFSEGGSQHWDYEHLSHFLVAPRSLVNGTAMAFAGIKNPQEEANLIAYLRSLSDNPAPLPEAPAAEGEAPAEGAPAEAAPAEGQQPAPAEGQQPAPAESQEAPAQPAQPAPQNDGNSAAPTPAPGEAAPAPAQPAN